MKKNKFIFRITFFVVLAAAIILRLSNFGNFPPSLNWDEVSHGYNAYSILKTGSDEWGVAFPLINFRAYGDYPLPLNLYLTIPSIAAFGLSAFSIRFPHMLLGVATVISVYFLALGLTKNKILSLFASFLASIGPWYFFESHIVLQSNISVFLLSTSAALFFNRAKRKIFLPLSIFGLFLTLFSYHSTRIFVPVFLIVLGFIYRRRILRKVSAKNLSVKISLGLGFITIITALLIIVNPNSRARSSWVFVIDQGAVNSIIQSRQQSKLPEALTRIIYNRPVYFAEHFATNYLGYFSPKYLFLQGGTQYQFSLPEHGMSFFANLPFFYLGLALVLYYAFVKKNKNWQVILAWFLLAPIPAAITSEKFAVLRSSAMLPLPEIAIALGVFAFIKILKNKKAAYWILGLYFVALALNLSSYLVDLRNNYSKEYSWSWQYGYSQVVDFIKNNYSGYDKIIITKKYGEPQEYLLFMWPWDPASYKSDPNLVRYFQSEWYWVDSFDKFYFVNDWQIVTNPPILSSIQETFVTESKQQIDCNGAKCLLITSPDNVPPGWKKLDTIDFLDESGAFEIYDNLK